MVEGLSTINHQGKSIVYIDYTSFANLDRAQQKEKVLQLMRHVIETYSKYPPKSVLSLVNVENVFFDMDMLNAFKNSRNETKYEKKLAVIGIKGLIKAAYNFVVGLTQDRSSVRTFDTKQEALDWLAQD